jgi:hypothetical protein
MNTKLIAVLVAALVSVAGCASPKKGPVPVPDPETYSGEGREWWNVYSIEFQGERKVRNPVGYVYRKYDDRDPKGNYYVQNLEQERIGFLLPDHKAYIIKRGPDGKYVLGKDGKPISEETGIQDLNLGVKRILGATGTIELEKVNLKPAGGAGAAQ